MIVVQIADSLARPLDFDLPEIAIGSDPSSALVLAGTRPRHCTLLPRAVGVFLVDDSGRTLVNGKPITEMRALYPDDRIQIGAHVIFVALVAKPDPTEIRLLAEIAKGEDDARIVYADWLDENGDPRRAELLRLEDILAERALAPHEERRRYELSVVIDVAWRVQITRSPVEGCAQRCTNTWADLARTTSPYYRRCRACSVVVRYCETRIENSRNPIVIDASVRRSL